MDKFCKYRFLVKDVKGHRRCYTLYIQAVYFNLVNRANLALLKTKQPLQETYKECHIFCLVL